MTAIWCRRGAALAGLLAGLASTPLITGGAVLAQIAVIVNKSNPADDIDLRRLARLYSGTLTTFGDTVHVALGEWVPARSRFYRRVLNLDETSVSRLWIGHVFSGGAGTPPKAFRDTEAALRFVRGQRGAVCFIEMDAVPDDVKVVTIGGLGPRAPNYPLR